MLPLELYYSATAWEAAVSTKQAQLRDSAQVCLSNHGLAEANQQGPECCQALTHCPVEAQPLCSNTSGCCEH